MTYTIAVELSELEKKALEYDLYSVDDWVINAAKQKAHVVIEEIISLNTEYCNQNGIAISVGKGAQIEQAYDLGIIQTAYQRQIAHEAKMKKELDALRVKESKNKNSRINCINN
tara:strand:+ start:236 stop:577 length:342 start_codon:yes stop_codon:yes gene_type:complete